MLPKNNAKTILLTFETLKLLKITENKKINSKKQLVRTKKKLKLNKKINFQNSLLRFPARRHQSPSKTASPLGPSVLELFATAAS